MRIILLSLASMLLAACAGDGTMQARHRFDQGEYAYSARGISNLAAQGDPQAQMDLGYLYQHGYGVPKDLAKAQEYYQKAADQGLVRADVCLALMLIWSPDIPHDLPRGIELLKRADAAGDVYGTYSLAWAYKYGIGVAKDEAEAERLHAKAGNTVPDILMRYAVDMRSHIGANQHFPQTALAGHYGGKVRVHFSIDVPYAKEAKIVSSSGHPDLDDAAIAAVYQTYYPSMPPGVWQPNDFEVEINFVYP